MDPLVIEVSPEGEPYRIFSPRQLLREADADEDCQQALLRYRQIIAEFPDRSEAVQAGYNSGLCNEVAEAWSEAVAAYDWVLARRDRDAGIALDAELRKAFCFEQLGRYDDAANIYRRISWRRDLPVELRVAVRLRRGIALVGGGGAYGKGSVSSCGPCRRRGRSNHLWNQVSGPRRRRLPTPAVSLRALRTRE